MEFLNQMREFVTKSDSRSLVNLKAGSYQSILRVWSLCYDIVSNHSINIEFNIESWLSEGHTRP